MTKWRHLFIDGEYSPRSRLLAGLTLAQVTALPPGASHSIYDELWHAAKWQSVVLEWDEAAAAAWVRQGPGFPSTPPTSERQWADLVSEFLAGVEKAVEWGCSPGAPGREVGPGITVGDELESLAVHNAYHLGKIVTLRQMIGAWPPREFGGAPGESDC